MSQSSESKVGKIKVQSNTDWEMEWLVEDILSYTKRDEYYSGNIALPGSEWYFAMHPNFEVEEDGLGGWISLFIYLSNVSQSKKAIFVLGMKCKDGFLIDLSSELHHVFDKNIPGYGCDKFIERSKLQKIISNSAPSGTVIFTCDMRLEDDSDCIMSMCQLSKDFKNIFTSEKHCDATLKVKDQEISVHRSILEARSSESLLIALELSSNNNVEIKQFQPEVFRDFIVYLYSGMGENFQKNVVELYKIAVCYGVLELKCDCVAFMMRNLSRQNVLDVALLADTYRENGLQIKAQDFFNEHFTEIVFTTAWSTFMKENHGLVCKLLKNMAKRMKTEKSSKWKFIPV